MVPATLASIAIHCVHAQIRCIIRLSESTDPLVRTFAILAINPNANSKMERLEASSRVYKMAVSSFSMEGNCFMGTAPICSQRDRKRERYFVPNSTVIVTDAFRKGDVGIGLGVNQIAGAAGFLIGPVVGGLLTEWSWRWVFLFNVPIGLFGVLWGIWRLREPVRPLEHQHIDWFGCVTLGLGLAGILF